MKIKRICQIFKRKKQVDWNTDTTITTKNIIVTFAENYSLNDGSGKGRQGLENIGKLKGYYITNGKAIEITCEKPQEQRKPYTKIYKVTK